MITISKINEFFHYTGTDNFDLSTLPLDIKNKINIIYAVVDNDQGNGWNSWENTMFDSLSILKPGKSYLLNSKSRVTGGGIVIDPYDIPISASLIKEQDDLVSKIYHIFTYQGCEPDNIFSLSSLATEIKNKMYVIYKIDDTNNGDGWKSWVPDDLLFNTFNNLDKTVTYLIESKSIGFASYDMGLPEPCETTPTPTPTESETPTPTPTESETPTPTPTPTETETPTPTPTSGDIITSANYNKSADWDGMDGNVTTISTNGRSSYYGTFDQTGNVWEWNDENIGVGPVTAILSGGSWSTGMGLDTDSISGLEAGVFKSLAPNTIQDDFGFRICASMEYASDSSYVAVGDVGNTNDTNGFGSVNYEYLISKYPIANCDYITFLDAVARFKDPYELYHHAMGGDRGGIIRFQDGDRYIYSIKQVYENKPVICVDWFSAARYCNWLHNNRPVDFDGNFDLNFATETGAYTMAGAFGSGFNTIEKNISAKFWIPKQNEWYKAAYYKGGGINSGYWKYATQTNRLPDPVIANSDGDGGTPSGIDFGSRCSRFLYTPTPTPTETPTPTPTESETPTPTPTESETPTPTPTETETPTPTPTPTESETPTPTPTESETPTPTPTESETPTPTPTPTTTPANDPLNFPLLGITANNIFTLSNPNDKNIKAVVSVLQGGVWNLYGQTVQIPPNGTNNISLNDTVWEDIKIRSEDIFDALDVSMWSNEPPSNNRINLNYPLFGALNSTSITIFNPNDVDVSVAVEYFNGIQWLPWGSTVGVPANGLNNIGSYNNISSNTNLRIRCGDMSNTSNCISEWSNGVPWDIFFNPIELSCPILSRPSTDIINISNPNSVNVGAVVEYWDGIEWLSWGVPVHIPANGTNSITKLSHLVVNDPTFRTRCADMSSSSNSISDWCVQTLCDPIVMGKPVFSDHLKGGGAIIEIPITKNPSCCCDLQYSVDNINWVDILPTDLDKSEGGCV